MTSLRGYVPALARHLGVSPTALYERQRALVRADLLEIDGTQKNGPGGGVRASSPSVAMLLITVLATDSLSETEAWARAVLSAKFVGAQSPFRTYPRFLDAVAAVLLQEGMYRKVSEIRVSRTRGRAMILPKGSATWKPAEFVFTPPSSGGVRIDAAIESAQIKQIGDDVSAIVNSRFEME